MIPDDAVDRSQRFGAVAPDLDGYDVTAELARVTASALLLFGADEAGATRGGVVTSEHIPGEVLAIIPESGHFPFIERPGQFLRRVSEFLMTGG